MSTTIEPNPPSRQPEDFPKTNTIPESWAVDHFGEPYAVTVSTNGNGVSIQDDYALPLTGTASARANGKAHTPEPGEDCPAGAPDTDDGLFTRRLEPFPSAWELLRLML
jgi:hypothetical protein